MEFIKKVIYGRYDLSPSMKKVLLLVGNESIMKIEVCRNPVNKLLTGTLNILSVGIFSSQNPYDNLFHLRLIFTLQSGRRVSLEKLEVPTMMLNPSNYPHTETLNIRVVRPTMTLNEIINKTIEKMKDNFFTYSAKSNNCQYFILNILNANHLETLETTKFIKQNTEEIFKNLDYLRKFTNTVTDIAQRGDVIIQGGNLFSDKGTSNIQINNILKRYKNFSGVYSKDKLPNKLKSNTWYVINMQNSYDGDGTHWVCFYYQHNLITYFDSFGFVPPLEVLEYANKNIIYSKAEIQDYNSTACGQFCIACIVMENKFKQTNINHFNNFIMLFKKNTKKNDSILYNILKNNGITI